LQQTMKTPCVHYEIINDYKILGETFRLGICKKCGQVRWYSPEDYMALPIVIKAGNLEPEHKKERVTMAKLKRREKKELLKLGVEKFMEAYHYNPRAKSALLQSYNKLLAKKAGKTVPSEPQALPILLSGAILLLPNPPRQIEDECREQIKAVFGSIIDALYGKQVLPCHDRRSARGG